MTHGSVAASVRKQKEAHPERFCQAKGCLWNITRQPCAKHPRQFHTGGATQPTGKP